MEAQSKYLPLLTKKNPKKQTKKKQQQKNPNKTTNF